MVLAPKLPRSIISCPAPGPPPVTLLSARRDSTLQLWRDARDQQEWEASPALQQPHLHQCGVRSLSLRDEREPSRRPLSTWRREQQPNSARRRHCERGSPPSKLIRVFVLLTPDAHEVEIDVEAGATVTALKDALAIALLEEGVAGSAMSSSSLRILVRQSRLLHGGSLLQDHMGLQSEGVQDGSKLRLVWAVPGARGYRRGHVPDARRGLLMTPGTKEWDPTTARKPREVLVYEANAPYSANLRHPVLNPHPPVLPPGTLPRHSWQPRLPTPPPVEAEEAADQAQP
mmetsp:Transcript_45575/g.108400  ORF Transcript_45575/g.108400 Transcript_45575/m.108400 type:complete len:287 (+) Transcript_45575:25-885(+)